ncbi:MAG: trypsin-like peptidase domain-containing protein [Acidobacteriota bacterium]
MSGPRLLIVVALLIAGGACSRREVPALGELEKMAYSVKPAVVRVSAFATADFKYSQQTLKRVEESLRKDGYAVRATELDGSESLVETGAGGSGSGFIINADGFILTSGHVVSPTRDPVAMEQVLRRNGAIAVLVRHFPVATLRTLHRNEVLDRYVDPLAAAGTLAGLQVVNQIELSNGETLPFRVLRYSPPLNERGMDLAVLRIERKNLPALILGDSDVVRVAEPISSVGYPAVASSTDEVIGGWLSRDSDLEATVNSGTITAIRTNVANMPVFQSNVGIYQGNSGGPAVNGRGEVIGISTWGHTSAEQIKFLVPINVARRFLAEGKIALNAGGEFNVHYRAALAAAGDGKWIEARKELQPAGVLFPKSPDLLRFGNDADRAIRALPLWRLHPIVTLAVAVGVGLVLMGGLVVAFRSREPRLAMSGQQGTVVETLVAPEGAGGGPHSMLGRFTILNGTRAGQKLGLGGSGIRIGRESTICEIVLENPKVSRLHAEVVSIDGKVLLIDRNSSNGTYVNDQKIDRRFLQDGDIIYFGGRNAVAVAFHA